MMLQEQLKKPSLAETVTMISMWTAFIAVWLFVLGCVLALIVVTVVREVGSAG